MDDIIDGVERGRKGGGRVGEVQASSPTPYQRRSCYPGASTGRRQGSRTKGGTEGRGEGERRVLSTSSQRETSVNMRRRRREGDVGDSSPFHANIMAPQARQYRQQSITRRPQHSKHSKRLAFQTASLSPGRFVPSCCQSWPPKRCKLNRRC